MATVKGIVRAEKKSRANIYFRLTDGRGMKIYFKSDLMVDPQIWDEKNQAVKVQKYNPLTPEQRTKLKKDVADITDKILTAYNAEPNKEIKTSQWLQTEVEKALHPERHQQAEIPKQSFFEAWDEFISKRKLANNREAHYNVVKRALMRFEKYQAITTKQPFTIDLDTLNADTLRSLEAFLLTEYQIIDKYPDIYKEVEKSHQKVEQRGANTVSDILKKIRAFYNWTIEQDKTTNNPFKRFQVEGAVYGTPYYITIEERNQLYNKDLSHRPTVAIQRDIFIFQCVIGCRVADLMNLTKSNIVDGAVEYIPRKTKEGRPVTVRVPLNTIAKEILSRYADLEGNGLFPFITPQKYNVAIKEAFTEAKLTREVTIINPTTREEDHQPLDKIASSHLARRCFIGNLYKQVKDPNLIGKLSGHAEGSKAFARYRDVDEQMKIDLVNLLN